MDPGVVDRVLESVAEAGGAEGHQDDGGAVIGGPHDALNNVAVLAEAGGIQHLHGHDLNVVVADARDSLQVVGAGGDDAGDPGAVAVFIGERVGAVEDGPAGNDNARQVGMCRVNAGIQDRNLGVEARVGHAVNLVPGNLRQSPLIRIPRVRWRALPLADVV